MTVRRHIVLRQAGQVSLVPLAMPCVTWQTPMSGPRLAPRGGGQRTPGQAAVGVPAGANVPAAAAPGGGAFQDRLMHRQDWGGKTTS